MGVFFTTSGARAADAREFSWARLVVAIVLLGGVLAAAIFTAGKEDLDALNTVLVHGFELTLGLVLGLLGGEAASRSGS